MTERWELCAFNSVCREKYHKLAVAWDYETTPLLTDETVNQLAAAARPYVGARLVVSGLTARWRLQRPNTWTDEPGKIDSRLSTAGFRYGDLPFGYSCVTVLSPTKTPCHYSADYPLALLPARELISHKKYVNMKHLEATLGDSSIA